MSYSLRLERNFNGRVVTKVVPVILAGGRAFAHSKEDALKWGVDLVSSSPRRAIVEALKHCGITRSKQELKQTLRLLGRRIQAGRKKKGLRQGQLASAAEIDRAYLSTLENGKKYERGPSAETGCCT